MKSPLLKTTIMAIPIAGLLALAPAVFAHDDNYNDYSNSSNYGYYGSPHERAHGYLGAEHESTHEELGAQHEAAHQYPMTKRQHRALHRTLKREHREAHQDLRNQHEDYHDQDSDNGSYGNYGRGYDGNQYSNGWGWR